MDEGTRGQISSRYHRITKAVNQAFWGSNSDVDHSIYVGSYGRGTAINTSDLDVLIQLPNSEYERFSSMYGNGQSRLLQAVKNAVRDTYPNTDIRGDGQVVVVRFTDGMKFEILPAFKVQNGWNYDETYRYPDTHMGGNWMTTKPKAEQNAMKQKNSCTNGLLFDTCKHIRYIRDTKYSSYHLSGILIDSFVYEAMGGWHFTRDGEGNVPSQMTYEEMLLKHYNEISMYGIFAPGLTAPGSGLQVDSTKGWDILGKVLNYMAN
ncbi:MULTISPECIES: SMODS domain-containing nucleotidyltransferase [Pseudobutyrivibrio]|uniref:SMODS domain-containing nucleotidyltransferase n=1 Tax=Pseudobutyrivibrio TaxID=46205 RepID=UPI001FA8A437|nr:nucleotidyltransferase domain-containing protein [Pseudobutyrivibrio sp. NOR37]